VARVKKTPDNPNGLTWRQRLFISYYLGKAKANATEAARLAGYASPREQGYENLTKPDIRAAIAAQMAEVTLPADEVLARLAEHATGDMGQFVKVDGKGNVSLDLKGARAADRLRLIKKIKVDPNGVSFELYDAQAALVQLGKYYGFFSDRSADAKPDTSSAIQDYLDSDPEAPPDPPVPDP
jgi:phage terminase small subunit